LSTTLTKSLVWNVIVFQDLALLFNVVEDALLYVGVWHVHFNDMGIQFLIHHLLSIQLLSQLLDFALQGFYYAGLFCDILLKQS
jgi:hypothetical protein